MDQAMAASVLMPLTKREVTRTIRYLTDSPDIGLTDRLFSGAKFWKRA
jgi:hypothetical protein